MAQLAELNSNGLLRPWERGRSFQLEQLAPSPALSRIVDRHWIARWDLPPAQPFRQEVLPHPSLNLVTEPDGAWVWGVPTERNSRDLRGAGWAVGSKFVPGAFAAITGIDASSLTDGCISLLAAFGPGPLCRRLETPAAEPAELIVAAEALLAPAADLEDRNLDLVASVIAGMRAGPVEVRVEEIAGRHHLAPRTLQKLFRRYVGVGPKWVLKRLRIHQATELLAAAEPASWADFAFDLGYYDQAHFIRDFRAIVGRSPGAYAAEAARGRAAGAT